MMEDQHLLKVLTKGFLQTNGECMITEDSFEYIKAAERLANAAEDILHTEYTLKDWEEFAHAWQAYVEAASGYTDNIHTD